MQLQNYLSEHYSSGYEDRRLKDGEGQLEYARTKNLIESSITGRNLQIADVGGGTGAYAFWLAGLGHCVHLVDAVPLHIEIAQQVQSVNGSPILASAEVGDARGLQFPDSSMDVVLLLGPLYHLLYTKDRMTALREAWRVLRPGGYLFAVAISRFASALDGLRRGYLQNPHFRDIVGQDLITGNHRNTTDNPAYFMDAFFHHPNELRDEVEGALFTELSLHGIEGPGWLMADFDTWWHDQKKKEILLETIASLSTEPSLLGLSAHIMAIGRKPHQSDASGTGDLGR